MIRVVAFLVFVGLLAAGFVWLADRPGDVAITWLGYHLDTSVMVMVMTVAAVAVATVILWSVARFIWRTPSRMRHASRERRRRAGHEAISRGLVAVGAGDTRAALRFAGNAERYAPAEPLALLLRAQAAQLSGNRAGAEDAFRAMAERADMRLLGLRGLYVEAQRRSDPVAARLFAEEAAKDAPAVPWANQAVLEFRSAANDWSGALSILESNRKSGMIGQDAYRRQRAVLLTARAFAAEESDRNLARASAVDAAKLVPDLVPAAALAGRLLAETGDTRKARRIVEAAWMASPHPDLAETYAHLRISDSARDRLARVERLAREPAGHVEGALAVARAALDAREFARARAALEPLMAAPTRRVALLMAELEKLEHGDEGRAREWMARALTAARDPAWTADGIVSERWLPVSPVTGRLDAFQWRVPLAELGGPAADIDHAAVLIEAAPSEVLPDDPIENDAATSDAAPSEVASPPLNGEVGPAVAEAAAPAARPAPAQPARPVPPIIPLTHAPDDPGPDPEAILDIELASEPPRPAWQRFRQLFR